MRRCSSCGASGDAGRFCRLCGAPLVESPWAAPAGAGGVPPWLWTVAGTAAVAILAGGIWLGTARNELAANAAPASAARPMTERADASADASADSADIRDTERRDAEDRMRALENEATALQEVRTVLSGQAAYQASNGGFYEGRLPCLASPVDCIPGYPPGAPTFLDPVLSSQASRGGYAREFQAGAAPPAYNAALSSASSVVSWTYTATPIAAKRTGPSSFCTDAAARLVRCADGRKPPVENGRCVALEGCEVLQ